jgi:hypothetical protein
MTQKICRRLEELERINAAAALLWAASAAISTLITQVAATSKQILKEI